MISLGAELARYAGAEVVWCQEEPRNMGAWSYVDRRLEELLGRLDMKAERPRYCGRDEAAAPATGSNAKHVAEQKKLIDEALSMA